MKNVNCDAFPILSTEIDTRTFTPQTFESSLEIKAYTFLELIKKVQQKKYRDELGQQSRDELKQKLFKSCGLVIKNNHLKLTEQQMVIFYSKIIAN